MPVDWNKPEMLPALVVVMWNVAKTDFSQEVKDDIIRQLRAVDSDVTWNGLRYVFFFL